MTSLGADLLIKASLDGVDKALQVKPDSVLVISDAKGAALFREFEGRRLAQVTVDSLHRQWIRSHIRISQNRSAP